MKPVNDLSTRRLAIAALRACAQDVYVREAISTLRRMRSDQYTRELMLSVRRIVLLSDPLDSHPRARRENILSRIDSSR